jgi:hypothetical protein
VATIAYVPVLTGKEGEFKALSLLSAAARAVMRPIVDLPPLRADEDPTKLVERLLKSVGGTFGNDGAVAVDLLGLHGRKAEGRHPVEYILDRHDWCAAGVQLAVSSNAPDEYIDVVASHHKRSRGICLRAQVREDGSAVELGSRIDVLLDKIGVKPNNVHLCLDCGSVKAWDRRPDEVLAPHLDSGLSAFGLVSVAATSVPTSPEIRRAERPNRFPRREWRAWRRLVETGHDVVFGDYGITGPRPTEPSKGLPHPHLRYTTDAALLIWRGRRADLITEEDEGQPTSFSDLCRELVDYGVTAEPSFSDGDLALAEIAAGKRLNEHGRPTEGSPSQWVQWATSHHLAHILDRVSGAAD